MKKLWTEYEIYYVLFNADKIDCYEMSKNINRTPDAIYTFLRKRNILPIKHIRTKKNKYAEKTTWSDKEMDILREKYPYYSNKEMCKFLNNKTPNGIRTMANKNGIKKCNTKSSKWYNKENMLKCLVKLHSELNRVPTILDVDNDPNIPSSKAYHRYFGNFTNACIEAGLTPSYSDKNKGCSSVLFSKNNDICYSNSEVMITNFFIDNNIEYKKEVLYAGIFNDDECNTKRADWVINGNIIIEFCGYPSDKEYMYGIHIKKQICERHDFKFIELYRKHIKHLNEIFSKYLSVETI